MSRGPRGIDCSHWQGRIDWARVAADGVVFAMCKATESTQRVDPRWTENRAGARAARLPVGAYHFARPGRVPAAESARHHLRHAHPQPGELAPALDLEDTGLNARDTTRWALEWLSIVEESTGSTPIVYTGPGFASTHLHPDPALKRYPLWVAHYTSRAEPRLPAPWDRWMWWQFTDSGPVEGIVGGVDTNRLSTEVLPLWPHLPPSEEDWFTMATKKDLEDVIDARLKAHGMVVVDQVDRADDAEHDDILTMARRSYAYAKALAEFSGPLANDIRKRAAEIDAAIRAKS